MNVSFITVGDFIGLPRWIRLEDACLLKNVSYKTITTRPWLQPNYGEPDAIVAGKKTWSSETIIKWLEVTDDQIPLEVVQRFPQKAAKEWLTRRKNAKRGGKC